MSLVNLAHVCSHLQNASKARLGRTSIPYTKLHQTVSASLLRAGLISSMTIGGPTAPATSSAVLGHSLLTAHSEAVTAYNRASRRLWLGLKYWNDRPVLGRMALVSLPTRRIWCGVGDLAALARGERRGYVRGLRQVGEVMFVTTDRGVLEIRECVERGVGGMLLCRAL